MSATYNGRLSQPLITNSHRFFCHSTLETRVLVLALPCIVPFFLFATFKGYKVTLAGTFFLPSSFLGDLYWQMGLSPMNATCISPVP